MTWRCPVCHIENGAHRRKCETDRCRYPGGPASAWQQKITRQGAEGGTDELVWACSCGYSNFASRRECKKCSGLPPSLAGPPPKARPVSPTRSAVRHSTAPGSNSVPAKGVKRKGKGDKTAPAAKGSAFYQAVLAEAAKNNAADSSAMDTKEEETDREKLQAELKKVEAAVQTLESVQLDEDLIPILESRRTKRDDIRSRLHAARPLKSQIKVAEEARDKLCRQHAKLSEELHSLKFIVQAKQQEFESSGVEVTKAISTVNALQAQYIRRNTLRRRRLRRPRRGRPPYRMHQRLRCSGQRAWPGRYLRRHGTNSSTSSRPPASTPQVPHRRSCSSATRAARRSQSPSR